jgi:hypothetical protein
MQIPYDLEFVENRPLVPADVLAGAKRPPLRRTDALPVPHDAIDRLLQWAFRVLRRFESRN